MEDVRFAIIDNELPLKTQKSNDVKDRSLNKDTVNVADVCISIIGIEDLVPTRELRIGEKIQVYWLLDDQYYPGYLSEYSEAIVKHRMVYDDGQVEN